MRNPTAMAFRRKRPPAATRIAVLIETSTSFGRGLLRGIARFARARNDWSLYLKPSGRDASLAHLKTWSVDGLLVRVHSRRLADQVLGAGIPAVDLGYVIPDLFPWRISNHQEQIGRLAAEHLLACGLRQFAFCDWGPAHPPAREWEQARLSSFREAVERQGFGVHTYEWPGRKRDRTWPSASRHLAAWLKSLPKPVGVLAANDERALEVLEAARLAGIDVPGELALLGVDNDEVLCEATSPTLSSIALNLERIGYEGASLLDRLMRNRPYPKRPIKVSPVGVVARASTDVVASADALVVAAIRSIQRRIHEPLQVADLLAELNVSRKTLENRFRWALGRTPYEEILRRRLERAKSLLADTDRPLKQIARESGFAYTENFHNVFRRETNQTPGEYRASRRPGSSG